MFRFLLVLAIAVVAHGNPAQRPMKLKDLKSRIVGGTEASIQNFPYQVVLFPTDGKDTYVCGGSILNKNWVMTAAHCMTDMTSATVQAGSATMDVGGKKYKTTKFKVHESYNGRTQDYDIALLDMRSVPITIDNKTTKATKLPAAGSSTPTNTLVTVSGFGTTHEDGEVSATLQQVQVKIVAQMQCKASYGSLTARMICAGVPEGGKDSCQGDSGGPLVKSSDKTQVGIVSYGIGCARPGIPGVYTNVASVRNWIKQNTGV